MTYYVRFTYIYSFFLGFDVRHDTDFPTENDLETNSTDSSETDTSGHWDGDIDRSDRSSYVLEAEVW